MSELFLDQASGLRRLFGGRKPPGQVVAFTSGRAGCGRTPLVVRTAAVLAAQGERVLLIDENGGAHNALAAFGVEPAGDLLHAVRGLRPLPDLLLDVAPRLTLLPAQRAAQELDTMTVGMLERLWACASELERQADFVLIDCAGEGPLSPLARLARHPVVITNAESNAITRAYARIKRLVLGEGFDGIHVAVTRARSATEAQAIHLNMKRLARDHLGIELRALATTGDPLTENLANDLKRNLPPGRALPVGDIVERRPAPTPSGLMAECGGETVV